MVSKFIFSNLIISFLLILHIMIDSNDIKQIWVVSAVKNIFGPKNSLFQAHLQIIFCLQIHFLEFYSLSFFSDIAYYNRLQWYLADSGGGSCQLSTIFSPKNGKQRFKFDQKALTCLTYGLVVLWCHCFTR